MLSLSAAAFSFAPALTPAAAPTRAAVSMESKAELEVMAKNLNPVLGFWDPMELASQEFWSDTNAATIGFLRHAELKHGRVAMAGFVGYIVQANGVHFPWNLNAEGTSFAAISAAGSPPEQWDALPSSAKLQIIAAIGVLEWFGESPNDGTKHYMRGGKPGYYPSLKAANVPHPVPFDLWDPAGLMSKMTPEQKEKGLLKEINNGRLAMIGIMGFCAAGKVPGSVPALPFIPAYSGEFMGPFSGIDSALPMVEGMLKYPTFGH